MSLRALKGRGNPSLRAKRGNLNLFLRNRTACSEQSEGIFFAPHDDTGIIAFVLIFGKNFLGNNPALYFGSSFPDSG
jgi:hypothetical protein